MFTTTAACLFNRRAALHGEDKAMGTTKLEKGNGLVALMVIIAVAVTLAIVYVRNGASDQRRANEDHAIQLLKRIDAAQGVSIQNSGEFTSLRLLIENMGLAVPVTEDLIGEKFVLHGYFFRMELTQDGQSWICYAWPFNSETGHRAFAISDRGDIHETDNEKLDPAPWYVGDRSPDDMLNLSIPRVGDHNRLDWVVIKSP